MGENTQKLRSAWREPADWLLTLARHCDATSQNQVAKRIGLSSGTISRLIQNRYAGDFEEMRRIVLAKLVDDMVECLAFGADIRAAQCHDYRRGNRIHDSAWRALLADTCPVCPHNLDRGEP